MYAVLAPEPGGPEALTVQQVPDPQAGPGEVVIDVAASAVNRADTLQRQGFYPPPPGASDVLGLECSGRIAEVGADVVEVHVYRWEPPPDLPAVDSLIAAIVSREVDAVTFTSAPAVEGLVHRAEAVGRREELLGALRGGVLACAVGPVTAAPLDRLDVPSIAPERFRLGAMVKRLEEHVAASS